MFIPGLMGSTLIDGSLTPEQARRECQRNLGRRDVILRGTSIYPCDKRPETLWGGVGSLHWLYGPDAWLKRIQSGNGYDNAGSVRAQALFEVDVRFGRRRWEFKPYAAFVQALQAAGADVLVVPYDWRLSCRQNARVVLQRVLAKWFGGTWVPRGQEIPESQRITFIGHSMGGLVARVFLEYHKGGDIAQRLITIGTPHFGSPQAYLHFIGRTFPFPENPFYRQARQGLVEAMTARQVAIQSDFGAQLLPGNVQTAAVKYMASTIELMPTYEFVRVRGQSETLPTTYGTLVHTGTNQPATRIMQEFRQRTIAERHLDTWLRGQNLEYHFLGATGYETTYWYDRTADRIETTLAGDGTVPLPSAQALPWSSNCIHRQTLPKGDLGHVRLCERKDVQAYCVNVLRKPRACSGVKTASMRDLQPEDLVAMSKWILRKVSSQRGVVLSIVRLAGDGSKPLIDIETEQSPTSSRKRLKNPPRHLSTPEIYTVESPRSGTFEFVWMLSNESATFSVGGFLLLPTANERHLYLVTFNVGQLDERQRSRCRNSHHAETQLDRFIAEQPVDWRRRLRSVSIANRSRRTTVKGYSPCNACCADLAHFLTSLNSLVGVKVDGTISWKELYTGASICGHPTDNDNLRRLEASGWTIDRDSPRPKSAGATIPASIPPELARAIAGGERDPNRLTNIVFFARHQDRRGRKIEPGETAAAREWRAIRDRVVAPTLKP